MKPVIGTPESISELEYKDSFAVKFPTKKTVFWTVVAAIFALAFSLLAVFVRNDARFIFIVFALLSAGLLLIYLVELSYKCRVDETALCESYCGRLKKKILWENIIAVKRVEKKSGKTVNVALYDQSRKRVAEFDTNMQNAWYVLKMAERKNIKIVTEKMIPDAWLKRPDR